MKIETKNEKGITMVALVITIVILVILTNILVYKAKDEVTVQALTNLYNDISLLREKVSSYYNEYGKIPAKIKYTNDTNIGRLSNILSEQDDIEKFYVIDLEAMKGITLNYGKDYEEVKNDENKANDCLDLYIINENSHNIFYIKGLAIEENNEIKTYYTDYIKPDETSIDLRYIDGVLIPEGYYYIGKIEDNNGNESIVISDTQGDTIDTNETNQFVWSQLEQIPDNITLNKNQKEYQFITSVKTYKGYFKNSKGEVQYVVIDEEKWSDAYTKELEYKDRNGDIITIPKGFRVSMAPSMNTVENGFVVKDSKNNEWVWIEIPKTIYGDSVTYATDYEGIYNALNTYAETYREGKLGQNRYWKDEWYYYSEDDSTTLYGYVEKEITNENEYEKAIKEGNLFINKAGIEATSGRYDESKTYYETNTSLTEEQKAETKQNSGLSLSNYTTCYKKMLSSVYINGGFWISRYEAGMANTNTDSTSGGISAVRYKHSDITDNSPKAVSQANSIPYNYLYCSEAQKLASEMSTDSTKTSSLLFGIQWDLVCKYLEVNAFNGMSSELNSERTAWGNFKDSSLILKEKSRYNTSPSSATGQWMLYNDLTSNFIEFANNNYKTNKDTSYKGLLTTGASEDAKKLNIYDFEGNEMEWTLEHVTSTKSGMCAARGGRFDNESAEFPVAIRNYATTTTANNGISFRATLY